MDDYKLVVKFLTSYQGYEVGQHVRYRQPNGDKRIHTIVSMGIDSDGDVWMKLEVGKAFFDWREILQPIDFPADFIEIDSDTDHWIFAEYDGRPYCVPWTEAHNDTTDAMMSEIPGQDDTVTPRKLSDQRFYKFCMAYLMQEGNLGVPSGRYGRDTRGCVEYAIVMSLVMQYHNGEPITYYQLNSDMGLVVNGADGVTELLSDSQYIFDEESGIDVKELLGDEYTPQTESEKLVAWINEHVAWVDAEQDGDVVTITCQDEDGVHNLLSSMNVEFGDN